jgi:trigger factor
MKASLEDISQVQKKLSVEIDAAEVNKKLNTAYSKIKKQTKIPGFRPGKVPRKILENYFGKQVEADVVSELVNETFPDAVNETNAFPLGQPQLEKGILKAGEPFTYSAVMEVKPQFEVKDYLGLEAEKEKAVVSDDDVEKRLEQIRESHGKIESIAEDRPVQKDDLVALDYEGFDGDSPIEGVKNTNFLIQLGRGDIHEKFDDALMGLKKGDSKEFTIAFEDDYHNDNLKGKSVRFTVSIVDVKEKQLPELDDEFAKNLGGDFENLAALKEQLKKNMVSQEENRINQELKGRLLSQLREKTEFELPAVMVEAEMDFSLRSFQSNLEQGGTSLEKAGISPEVLKAQFRPTSEMRVKDRLILTQIAEQEKLSVTDEEYTEGLENLAASMGQDVETIRKYYEARGEADILKEQMLEDKTLNHLVENATVKEVEPGALTQEKNEESEVE